MESNIPPEARLLLTDAVTLQSIETVHARLLEMAAQPTVEIDCGRATEVDLSLIQLILAARKSAHNAGRTVTLAEPAAGALRETLLRGGFLDADGNKTTPDQAFWLQTAGL